MMFHPLSLFIGLRYTRAKRKNHFINFISVVSIGGIALGITTMIVVLSVMNGFQHEVRERSLAMTAHVSIQSQDDEGIYNWQHVASIAQGNPQVLAAAPYTNGQGLLSHEGQVHPVQIQGIHPTDESKVSNIHLKMGLTSTASDNAYTQEQYHSGRGQGQLQDLVAGEFGIVLGADLAQLLGVAVGDQVSLISSVITVNALGASPRIKRFTVVGIFDLGIYEYDSSVALIHIEDAGKIFRIADDAVQGVRLKLNDVINAYEIAVDIDRRLESQYFVFDWTKRFAALFRMIQIEKMSMFVIMSLIVAVAVFNVVSTLVMVVTDKRSDIAILRTMGMSPMQVMAIFMVQGVVIGFMGASIGIALGVLIASHVSELVAFIQRLFRVTLFEPSVYPISNIPSLVLASDVIFVAGFAFILASLATLYPAWQAARTQPAEALRYE